MVAQSSVCLITHAINYGLSETGFSNSRFATQQDHLTFAFFGLLPASKHEQDRRHGNAHEEIHDRNPVRRTCHRFSRVRIRDGDSVYVESRTGRVKGRVRVTEGVHPEVLGTVGTLGHWARGKPISRGQGVHSNSLIATDWSMVDPLSGQIDTCARVRVYRAEDQ